MRGEILLKALEIIEEFAYTTTDFVEAFLSSSKSDYSAIRNFTPRYHKTIAETIREELQEKQRLYELIHGLQKDGLMKKVQKNNKLVLRITQKGQEKKEKLRTSLAIQQPYKRYEIEKSQELIIVAFDIPEIEKKKRNWLRAALINLGFQMLQKSVWIGKIKIPQEFIEDMQKLKLVEYVEIFSVSRTGTIRHLI